MLIANLLPLLERYSLGFDLVAGPEDTVTLTIIPRVVDGGKHKPSPGEIRPISLTASAAEIDAELARGEDGALGTLIAARKALGDQLAEQREAAEVARVAAAEAAKARSIAPKATADGLKATDPGTPPLDAKSDEPASLW
ncbi:PRTRC system protein E [Novosphingobium resinovorum]|uniref:PRTRC system protein E n=1 Tax=Novosphingobium TaxID=165696 RepID=UPI001B3C984C|nr:MULTISPECIES: PRTRC system protein E [Novosphingobium]MBF7013750.1 PRTRC system protein E [Novosphingobium sp. HR1a]WJM25893.1 PRTRC system protein E [Novosphingobium resinovorum]